MAAFEEDQERVIESCRAQHAYYRKSTFHSLQLKAVFSGKTNHKLNSLLAF